VPIIRLNAASRTPKLQIFKTKERLQHAIGNIYYLGWLAVLAMVLARLGSRCSLWLKLRIYSMVAKKFRHPKGPLLLTNMGLTLLERPKNKSRSPIGLRLLLA
jgi:hypothetical protein